MLEIISEGVMRLAALAALEGALCALLGEGAPQRRVALAAGLLAACEMASLLARIAIPAAR